MQITPRLLNSYYDALKEYRSVGAAHERAVKTAFHGVLETLGRDQGWTLVPEWTPPRRRILTLAGIPPEAHRYRLGNRSALDWLVDQYRIKTDKRSGITHDPITYSDNPAYIVKLIKKVTTVSVETVGVVEGLGEIHGKLE